MVNKFGIVSSRGLRGPRGPAGVQGVPGERGNQGPRCEAGRRGERGARGVDGSIDDMCEWLPRTVLQQFRHDSEDCCFMIEKLGTGKGSHDVKTDDAGKSVLEWTSRSASAPDPDTRTKIQKRLVGARDWPKPLIEFVYERGCMKMEKSMLYSIQSGIRLTNSYVALCLTFKIRANSHIHEEQYVVSNWEDPAKHGSIELVERGIAATSEGIRILGAEEKWIAHDCTKWTTLFVEWGVKGLKSAEGQKVDGCYLFAGNRRGGGTFVSRPADAEPDLYEHVYIGGRSDNTRHMDGWLASVEWYSCEEDRIQSSGRMPFKLRDLILHDQVMDEEATPVSRMNRDAEGSTYIARLSEPVIRSNEAEQTGCQP